MNIHVTDLTPTQRICIERSQNFRASIAAKAVELADRKTRIKLAAIPIAALETPLMRTPQVTIVTPDSKVTPSEPNWFVVLASEPKRRDYPSILQIQKVVAAHFKVTVSDIMSRRRTADIVLPRQIAVYLCKEMTLHSYPQIGRRFGGRDHTTQIHSVQKIKGMIDRDEEFSALVSLLISQLGAICA